LGLKCAIRFGSIGPCFSKELVVDLWLPTLAVNLAYNPGLSGFNPSLLP